ncbi:MAG TPA: endonuclease domain-containing protein [Verrucomicrobiae bacterium]|nr:endonuclease domain-containing protein [Verrucomicrobiae bacterium]
MRPNKYNQFIFEDYQFDENTKILKLQYAFDDALKLTETYKFDFDFAQYNQATLDRAFQLLFFMAGVSYYKMYIPSEIVVRRGQLDRPLASFFSKTYQRGLGEFWYENQLDPRTPVTFPITTNVIKEAHHTGTGPLASVGGGKDSLVAIELLRPKHSDLATWSVNHRPQLTPLVERIGLPHKWVERQWDKQIMELKEKDALNGHIPISAIFACVGTVVAILTGKRDVVMANEQSANEPTLHYQGVAINHQYSKSEEFEQDFQAVLTLFFGDSIRYYSLLRPFSELRIAEFFARLSFEKYKDVFSSCNRAYIHTSDRMSWCGECPKCAFIFLMLTPFIPRADLEKLWSGKNLLHDPKLEPTYEQLLGIAGEKPLECVGEVKESRAAMTMAQTVYPDLLKYHYELPPNYDYKTIYPSRMPEDMLRLAISQV